PNSSPVSMATSLNLSTRVRQQALCTFKQSGNVESYTQQFNVHASNSDWSKNILVSLYRGGLKENIRLAIVSSAMQLVNKLESNRNHTFKITANPLHYRNRPKYDASRQMLLMPPSRSDVSSPKKKNPSQSSRPISLADLQ
ncbi:hypothetical protein VP01_10249g1, partial [Puccinia sorghi]